MVSGGGWGVANFMYHECEKAQMRWFMWTETISESGSGKAWKTELFILSAACFRVCPNVKRLFTFQWRLSKRKKIDLKKLSRKFFSLFSARLLHYGDSSITRRNENFFFHIFWSYSYQGEEAKLVISVFHKIKLFSAHFLSLAIFLSLFDSEKVIEMEFNRRKFSRHVHGRKIANKELDLCTQTHE